MTHAPHRPVVRRAPHVRGPAATLLIALVATLVVGAVGPASATARTAPAAAATGWIRAGHLAPGTPAADVRLTPYDGGRAQILSAVRYGQISDYTRVPVGLYAVALVPAGAGRSAKPMLSRNVRVGEGSASTVLATGRTGQVSASVLSDDLSAPPAGEARVRLVSAVTRGPGVDAQVVGGPPLARNVTTGSATGYAEVTAQAWTIRLSSGSSGRAQSTRVTVRAGGVYTLLAVDGAGGAPRLQAVMDSAGSTGGTGAMPSGGVDTGGGGLARVAAGGAANAALDAALLVVRRGAGPT